MTYETYRLIFTISLISSIVLLVITVILFFALRILRVIGDLSGSNARKAIQTIREQNQQTGTKAYKSSPVNLQRGRLTNKISVSGRLEELHGATNGLGMPTEKIPTAPDIPSYSNETTVLPIHGNETTVLYGQMSNEAALPPQGNTSAGQFAIIYEITFRHTNEMIVI